jgi:hypothetical protein
VAAGERAAEQADAVRVDPVEVARVRQRAVEVRVLARDVEQLAGLAAAGAEVAVIEQQHPDPGRAEALGVGGEAQLLGRAEAVRHHHQRPRSVEALRLVQPAGAPVVAGVEGDIGAHRVLLGVRLTGSRSTPCHGSQTAISSRRPSTSRAPCGEAISTAAGDSHLGPSTIRVTGPPASRSCWNPSIRDRIARSCCR